MITPKTAASACSIVMSPCTSSTPVTTRLVMPSASTSQPRRSRNLSVETACSTRLCISVRLISGSEPSAPRSMSTSKARRSPSPALAA